MTREWWADGPREDPYDAAFERARDEIIDDEEEAREVADKVLAEFHDSLLVLASDGFGEPGAADLGKRIAKAGKDEIDRRAHARVMGWKEDRALARAGL